MSIINSFVAHCIFAAAAVAFAATAHAVPVPVLSNLNSPATSGNATMNVGNATPGPVALAQGFTTGVNPLQLSITKISLDLSGQQNSVGTPVVQLWSNVSNLPGAPIGSFAAVTPTIGAGSNPAIYDFTGWVDLSPNTSYWVVLSEATPATGRFFWDKNLTDAPPTAVNLSGYTSLGGGRSTTNGATWTASSSAQGLSMELVAVPEPPTIILAGLGAAAVVGQGLRRRKLQQRNAEGSEGEWTAEEGAVALTA